MNSECEEENPTFLLRDEKILGEVPENPIGRTDYQSKLYANESKKRFSFQCCARVPCKKILLAVWDYPLWENMSQSFWDSSYHDLEGACPMDAGANPMHVSMLHRTTAR